MLNIQYFINEFDKYIKDIKLEIIIHISKQFDDFYINQMNGVQFTSSIFVFKIDIDITQFEIK